MKKVTPQQDETVITNGSEASIKKQKPKFFTAGNMAVMGILTAIAYVLYFATFSLPIFPKFLKIQISDLPALLGGFALGPWASVIIIVIKCLLQMPFSHTSCVGEATDILIGIAFTVPAALMYQRFKNRKGAIAGMCISTVCAIVVAMLVNWLISVPFYAKNMFGNGDYEVGMAILTDSLSILYPWITRETFYVNYLFIGVLPFNALRCIVSAVVTYFTYKPLSRALHWEIKTKKQKLAEQSTATDEQPDKTADNTPDNQDK